MMESMMSDLQLNQGLDQERAAAQLNMLESQHMEKLTNMDLILNRLQQEVTSKD